MTLTAKEPRSDKWPKVRIGDALELINGRAFKPTEWSKTGTPIVRIQNLNNQDAAFNYYQGDLPAKFALVDGDLLFAWSGTPGTSFGAHIWRRGKAWLNQHIFVVRFDEEMFDGRFLQLAINQNLTEYIRAAHGGAGLAHITKGRFEESELPLPPLDEQRWIVAEIETQFTRLDAGVTALRQIQAKLKRYCAAVLNDATKVSWPSMMLSEISEVVTGSTPSKARPEYYGEYVPFIKPGDLNVGYRVEDAKEHLSLEGARVARILPANSVLVTCIGATLGKSGLARVRCATNQQINSVIPHDHIVTPEWIYWMICSPPVQEQIKAKASATTLPILNKGKFSTITLPIPPLAEQFGMIADIERRLSVADAFECTIQLNLRRAEALREAILRAAFSGEL